MPDIFLVCMKDQRIWSQRNVRLRSPFIFVPTEDNFGFFNFVVWDIWQLHCVLSWLLGVRIDLSMVTSVSLFGTAAALRIQLSLFLMVSWMAPTTEAYRGGVCYLMHPVLVFSSFRPP